MTQRRLPPAARRQQIIGAAGELMVERGLSQLSLRDIARHAGVAMGTVTYHFDSVTEILSAVIIEESERFYADVVRAADAEPDPWAALRILNASLFSDAPEVRGHWRLWTDYWAVVARHPEIAETYADRIRHWEHCCARVITRGVASGMFARVDAAGSALKLAAYSDGLGAQLAQGVDGLSPDVAAMWLEEFARLMLRP